MYGVPSSSSVLQKGQRCVQLVAKCGSRTLDQYLQQRIQMNTDEFKSDHFVNLSKINQFPLV